MNDRLNEYAATTVKAEQVQCSTCNDTALIGDLPIECPDCCHDEAPSLPAAGSSDLTAVRCQCCATEYPHDSYDAGFIAGSGMCQVCDAAMPPKDLPAAGSVELEEAAGILRNMIDSINVHGNYSKESTLLFLNQALSSIVAALSAQQSAPERVSVPVELLQDLHDLASDAVDHHRQAFAGYKLERQANMDATVDKARALIASHGRGEA